MLHTKIKDHEETLLLGHFMPHPLLSTPTSVQSNVLAALAPLLVLTVPQKATPGCGA